MWIINVLESVIYNSFGLVLATQKPHLFKVNTLKVAKKKQISWSDMLWLNLFNIYIKFIKLALIWVQSHRFSSIRFEMTLNFRWKVQLLWWCKNCKNAFFKMNVFWNSYLRGAKKMKERNQSELDKIVFPELYNPFFRFNVSFFIAELHRFLWSLLAGYTLYSLFLCINDFKY